MLDFLHVETKTRGHSSLKAGKKSAKIEKYIYCTVIIIVFSSEKCIWDKEQVNLLTLTIRPA